MSLSGEQIQAIIDEHTSVTDALKAQRDKFEKEAQTYKAEAEKVPEIQKELAPCPCVVISRSKADSRHDYPSLEFDSESLLSCCLNALKAKGCKRIAALVSANISTKRLLRMQRMLEPMPQEWMVGSITLRAVPC